MNYLFHINVPLPIFGLREVDMDRPIVADYLKMFSFEDGKWNGKYGLKKDILRSRKIDGHNWYNIGSL